jgi:hypothetical protein
MNNYAPLYKQLADSPESQLASRKESDIRDKLEELAHQEDPKQELEDLVDIINQCVHYGLCSDFMITTLNGVSESLAKHHEFDLQVIKKESVERVKR